MMDATALYPEGFHPICQLFDAEWTPKEAKHYTRTRTPVKYYFIDYGISCRFDLEDTDPREIPVRAGDKTAPDFSTGSMVPINPFPTDVYYIGNFIRTDILKVLYRLLVALVGSANVCWDVQTYRNLNFVNSLVEEMVAVDPKKRPTMDEVVERFEKIRHSLPWWTLRARLWYSWEVGNLKLTLFLNVRHFLRTVVDIFMLRSAIPTCR